MISHLDGAMCHLCAVCRRPLHWACTNRHLGVAQLLLKNKADANATTDAGRTPLHLSVVKNSQVTLVDWLLAADWLVAAGVV